MLTADYLVMAVSMTLTVFCWWAIRHSGHGLLLKISLTFLAAIPFVGPFIYLFSHKPLPPAAKESAVLKRWNEREHIYLGAASLVFWSLAVLAYWMNDWQPGAIRQAPFNLGFHTDVDRIFFALLIGAVITFALAIRAKAILLRKLREASLIVSAR
jgi:hypothetical protein